MPRSTHDLLKRSLESGQFLSPGTRSQFYSQVEALSRTEGAAKVLKLLSCFKSRMPPRVYMQSGIVAHKASAEKDDLITFIRDIYRSRRNDTYVCQAYARAMFSNGDIHAARDLLVEHHQHAESTDFDYRTIELLVDMGFYAEAKGLLSRDLDKLDRKQRLVHTRIARSEHRSPATHRPDLATVIINLDRDVRKYRVAESVYNQIKHPVARLSAVSGSTLPRYLRLAVDPRNLFEGSPGTVGCAISHTRAWEVAAGNDFTLILEDDGLPFYSFGPWISDLLHRVQTFDVLFVNERMSSLRDGTFRESGVVPITDRLKGIPETQVGWGGDGYILSASGAKKLLSLFEADMMCGHIDGQMGAYGVAPTVPPNSRALGTALGFRKLFSSDEVIDAYCLNFPLIHQVNFGFSSRDLY